MKTKAVLLAIATCLGALLLDSVISWLAASVFNFSIALVVLTVVAGGVTLAHHRGWFVWH